MDNDDNCERDEREIRLQITIGIDQTLAALLDLLSQYIAAIQPAADPTQLAALADRISGLQKKVEAFDAGQVKP